MRADQRAQPSLADEPLVDAAEPPAVGRVHGDAERHGLAVHRPAGRDHQVREGDQALPVDRPLRHDQRRQADGPQEARLVLGARQHHRVHLGVAAEPVDDLAEQRVRLAVVERHVRRRRARRR